MTSIKNIVLAAAASTILSFAAQAEEVMRPMQGATFTAGTQHATVYFLSNATCKLVLTTADDANYAPKRFEVEIANGSSTRYELVKGKALEFGCHDQAQAMTVNMVETIATTR